MAGKTFAFWPLDKIILTGKHSSLFYAKRLIEKTSSGTRIKKVCNWFSTTLWPSKGICAWIDLWRHQLGLLWALAIRGSMFWYSIMVHSKIMSHFMSDNESTRQSNILIYIARSSRITHSLDTSETKSTTRGILFCTNIISENKIRIRLRTVFRAELYGCGLKWTVIPLKWTQKESKRESGRSINVKQWKWTVQEWTVWQCEGNFF